MRVLVNFSINIKNSKVIVNNKKNQKVIVKTNKQTKTKIGKLLITCFINKLEK